MSSGTPSMGKHNKITHIRCRRCGRHSYHIQKSECSACGYPLPKLKKESWKWKPINRAKRKNLKHGNRKKKTSHLGKPRK